MKSLNILIIYNQNSFKSRSLQNLLKKLLVSAGHHVTTAVSVNDFSGILGTMSILEPGRAEYRTLWLDEIDLAFTCPYEVQTFCGNKFVVADFRRRHPRMGGRPVRQPRSCP